MYPHNHNIMYHSAEASWDEQLSQAANGVPLRSPALAASPVPGFQNISQPSNSTLTNDFQAHSLPSSSLAYGTSATIIGPTPTFGEAKFPSGQFAASKSSAWQSLTESRKSRRTIFIEDEDEDDEPDYNPREDSEDGIEPATPPMPTSDSIPRHETAASYVEPSRISNSKTPLVTDNVALKPKLPFRTSAKARVAKNNIDSDILKPITAVEEPKSKRPAVEDDPDDLTIMRLRCDEHYGWQTIADMLNEERKKNGEDEMWTPTAVYSRFTRNGQTIAKARSFQIDPEDIVHIQNQKTTREKQRIPEPAVPSETLTMHLLDAVQEASVGFWEQVADAVWLKTGVQISPDRCHAWFDQIGAPDLE